MEVKIISDEKKYTPRMTKFSNGWSVETWRNHEAKAWVVQIKNSEGYQVGTHDLDPTGETSYEYRSSFAKKVHEGAIHLVLTKSEAACEK